MNLMFWKKKTGTEETGLETPEKPGLVARMKLLLGNLTRPFKKTPVFRAEVEPDLPGGSEEPDAAAFVEPEPEAPAKPGLTVRMKSRFIALVQRFRETPAKPGLPMRIKAEFVAFIRKLKAPAAGEEEEAGTHGRSAALPEEGETTTGETAAGPVRSRKWLVVSGSILIVVLLVVDIAITLWLSYESPQKRWGTRHDTISSLPGESESMPEEPRSEVEALRKENAGLQAQIEALRKEQQRRPYAPPAWQTGEGNMPSYSASGEMAVGSSDPKAAAMTLKEAIEAMNASSGDYDKKPANK